TSKSTQLYKIGGHDFIIRHSQVAWGWVPRTSPGPPTQGLAGAGPRGESDHGSAGVRCGRGIRGYGSIAVRANVDLETVRASPADAWSEYHGNCRLAAVCGRPNLTDLIHQLIGAGCRLIF